MEAGRNGASGQPAVLPVEGLLGAGDAVAPTRPLLTGAGCAWDPSLTRLSASRLRAHPLVSLPSCIHCLICVLYLLWFLSSQKWPQPLSMVDGPSGLFGQPVTNIAMEESAQGNGLALTHLPCLGEMNALETMKNGRDAILMSVPVSTIWFLI